ncbi:MAG: hypothetical protein OP8BY_2463 [Candidatus Saccharicenans subterraneus]|uniref:Uncharacterized protein n=1 Tax=Candidatus Saccharicenans subterraneus TaxID=2508984 RepID=A0A3E2BIY0_9BACT|nr:MAG: hypothetical protein OP8BY_2463 [Candidatus Saccharicenans subterraneum]
MNLIFYSPIYVPVYILAFYVLTFCASVLPASPPLSGSNFWLIK